MRKLLPLTLVLALTACCTGEASQALYLVCPDGDVPICSHAISLTQRVRGNTRYFRYWDCTRNEWVSSSCKVECEVELR